MDGRRRPRPRLRLVVGGAAIAVLIATGVLATLGLGGGNGTPATPRRSGPAATAVVVRETLMDAVTLAGELNYGGAIPLASASVGTVTWLPEPGAIVARGEAVFRVDDQAVPLLYGQLPMYRALADGAKGNDVKQLETNLAALGYHDFTVDDTFSAATTDAVKQWQKSLGRTQTGTVEIDQVVYASGPIRVAQRLVRVGAKATGDVLSYTGTTRVVTVTASTAEVAWAQPGLEVAVTLPGGAKTVGKISSAVPVTAQGQDNGGASTMVTVAIEDQAALGDLTTGLVQVRHVVQTRADVLVVPVSALLALAEGGYGLEVVEGGTSRVVAVEVGLFAGGQVEVSGPDVREGMTVGLPA